ncbi:hypothetical protein KY361_05710 [Candidatus Woesearchaeota archaeon]|nr:hypothetical protein [Candidatus Woesearchaeota archaeon]
MSNTQENVLKKESGYKIPVSIFKKEKLSPFEAIVKYLKDDMKLTYHEIGILLNRDERNIWTVYNRARKK